MSAPSQPTIDLYDLDDTYEIRISTKLNPLPLDRRTLTQLASGMETISKAFTEWSNHKISPRPSHWDDLKASCKSKGVALRLLGSETTLPAPKGTCELAGCSVPTPHFTFYSKVKDQKEHAHRMYEVTFCGSPSILTIYKPDARFSPPSVKAPRIPRALQTVLEIGAKIAGTVEARRALDDPDPDSGTRVDPIELEMDRALFAVVVQDLVADEIPSAGEYLKDVTVDGVPDLNDLRDADSIEAHRLWEVCRLEEHWKSGEMTEGYDQSQGTGIV